MGTPLQEPTFWILTALTSGRRHGYAILADVARLTEGRVQLRVTTLYAALERLCREGLITDSGDETVDGRRRRYFDLTRTGAEVLEADAERMAVASHHATRQLRGFGWISPEGAR